MKTILLFHVFFIEVANIEAAIIEAENEARTNQINLTESDMKNGNFDDDPVHCFEYIDDNINIKEQAMFWIDGVLIPVIGGFGLIGNIISTAVLQKCPGNRCFNTLLS